MKAESRRFEMALPGIREDNPRDFLAALGLLRLVDALWPESDPKLSWSQETGSPKISSGSSLPEDWGDRFYNTLLGWKTSDRNPFRFGKIESIEPSVFRDLLINEADHSDFLVRYFASLASQIPHERTGRRSEFIIESASRSVLNGINSLLENRRPQIDIQADFEGHGVLREVSNTSRWHPAEFKSAAYASADPQDTPHRDFPSLNLFALFGLTFYPAIDTQSGRKTLGIRRIARTTEFSWPLWEEPLDPSSVASLVNHPLIHQKDAPVATFRGLGIYQVWRSRKFKPDGKNDYFSPAQPSF